MVITAGYSYPIPKERIAQEPASEREGAQLLLLERASRTLGHHRFSDLPALLRPGDCLVVNDSRVIPARLEGRTPAGARVELLLVRRLRGQLWSALARPGRRCLPGVTIEVDGGRLRAHVIHAGPQGGRSVRLDHAGPLLPLLEEVGGVPLPPYIRRETRPEDRERYQTVFARHPGSVAAPTAGLHLSRRLLGALRRRGIGLARITLHVGPGTFRPIGPEGWRQHRPEEEFYRITPRAAATIAAARRSGGRVVAVGTTSVRALETAAWCANGGPPGIQAGQGWTSLFIHPPYRFRAVDALVTNFHPPRSTTLILTATFAGRGLLGRAYAEALQRGYRFYSYGDGMLIL